MNGRIIIVVFGVGIISFLLWMGLIEYLVFAWFRMTGNEAASIFDKRRMCYLFWTASLMGFLILGTIISMI